METRIPCSQVSDPLHYVTGGLSPFYVERMFSRDRRQAAWAVYFSPYTSNGSRRIGVGQGGAISSIFDVMTACLAALYVQGRTPTAHIDVRLRKPTTPIPGAFLFEARIDQDVGSRVIVEAQLSDGEGNLKCECSATLARLKPRL